MNVLSTSLQAKIKERPTDTIALSNQSKEQVDQYNKLLKLKDTLPDDVELPDVFDGRVVWEGVINPAVDQGACGSCWSFASVGHVNLHSSVVFYSFLQKPHVFWQFKFSL